MIIINSRSRERTNDIAAVYYHYNIVLCTFCHVLYIVLRNTKIQYIFETNIGMVQVGACLVVYPVISRQECYECGTLFTTFKRRHHCRLCGQIFCYDCCSDIISGKIAGHSNNEVIRKLIWGEIICLDLRNLKDLEYSTP